jgi:hypothetical protein
MLPIQKVTDSIQRNLLQKLVRYFLFFFLVFFMVVLGVESKGSCMIGKLYHRGIIPALKIFLLSHQEVMLPSEILMCEQWRIVKNESTKYNTVSDFTLYRKEFYLYDYF